MWLVRIAQAILFTNRVTRGQLNKRNEALQLLLAKHRADIFLHVGISACAHHRLPFSLSKLISATYTDAC